MVTNCSTHFFCRNGEVNLRYFFLQLTSVCLLLAAVSAAQTPSDVLLKQVIDDVYEAAPHNRFCNRTEPTIEKSFASSQYPCLLPCSCDHSTCWDKLPCCPDIPQPKPERRRNSSCHYPVISSEPYNSFNHPSSHVNFPIRMVHDCEREYIASELHRKCLLFRNTSDVELLVPVVSNSTGIVYANRFCAECSGITNYDTFTVQFMCSNRLLWPDKLELLSLEWNGENRIKLIKAGICNYVFNAQNIDAMESNRCMKVRYTACNASGEWDFKDQFLEDACNAYELTYRDIYKNYHCMLCNNPSRYSSPENRPRINPICLNMGAEILQVSRVVGKPTFCICENKDADQLRGNREADQRLCFRYIDSTIPLLPKSKISSL